MYGGMMGGYGGYGAAGPGLGWAGLILGNVLPLLILGLVIWGAVVLANRAGGGGSARRSDALDTLEMRFAQGEISAEELRTMRQELKAR